MSSPAATPLSSRGATRREGPREPVGQGPPSARKRWWRDARRRRLLAVADLIAATTAASVATISPSSMAWALAFVPLWLLVAKFFGLYDRDHQALRHLTADEVPALLGWAGACTALLALLLPLTPDGQFGTEAAVIHFSVIAIGAIGLRSLARKVWWLRTPPEVVALLGDPPGLASMRRKFGLFRDMHFDLAVDRRIDELGTGEHRHHELIRLAASADRIVVAAGSVDTDLIADLNAVCRDQQVKLSVVSPLRGKALPSLHIAQVADLPIFEYNTWDPSRSSLLIKRIFDIVVAGVGLLILTLLLPLIALAIKLDSPGRIFFSQVRAGLGGRPFRMYKLRTMQVGAERLIDEIVDFDDLRGPAFKIQDDPRVTRVGRILRRLSLDEVPQLFNVLVGEMSTVGPRPEQVEMVDRYTQEDRFRLTVKPGVTGPMQVFGRGELTFEERLAVELEYVENPSLARDLSIILHTVPAVARGTGAY